MKGSSSVQPDGSHLLRERLHQTSGERPEGWPQSVCSPTQVGAESPRWTNHPFPALGADVHCGDRGGLAILVFPGSP